MKGTTTNKANVMKFLPMIRQAFVDPDEKVFLVLDNHPSHHTKDVKELAKNLNIELMFLPPYSPELNSIESLWGIIKRRFKKALIENKTVILKQ